MKLRRIAGILSLSILSGVLIRAQPAATVDRRPAITIDGFTTSRYLFDKAYHRFLATTTGRNTSAVPPDALEQWYRLYTAQLVIKAEVVNRRELEQPEVMDMTTRMTRYMLTQPNGPLYRELGAAEPIGFHRERRARILRECQFSPVPEHVELLWTALRSAFGRQILPADADVAPIANSILATYVFDGNKRQISAEDFIRDFQQRFVRLAPTDVITLGEQVEDMVVSEYDFSEAKRRHLDQAPEFIEDRRNFALNQGLAWYEREVLLPKAAVSPEEVRTAYRTNLARYSSPTDVRGTLLIYSDLERARRSVSGTPKGSPPSADSIINDYIIRQNDGPAFHGIPYLVLVRLPEGQEIGPFSYSGQVALFFKRGTGELLPQPFAQVEAEIRQQLEREKIETLELENLIRNLGHVRVFVDLSTYGLTPLSPAGQAAAKL